MLTEEIKLIEVSILPESNAVNVCWQHRILRNGEVIISTNHRCAYNVSDKAKFESDLGVEASKYLGVLGW